MHFHPKVQSGLFVRRDYACFFWSRDHQFRLGEELKIPRAPEFMFESTIPSRLIADKSPMQKFDSNQLKLSRPKIKVYPSTQLSSASPQPTP
jgi:hypothetical protein